jgi:ribose transport system ATP-binding protein
MAFGELILNIEKITKKYAGVTVLKDMDFTLREGEIHCIVGENGAGKSTFIKALSGAIAPDSGTINVFGKCYYKFAPLEPIRLGISTIYQDVDLVDTLSVADNIFLGGEINKAGVIDRAEQEKKSSQLLAELSIKMDPHALVETLSPAQKQTLQLVKAMYRKSKILIMDEPTASLGEEETTALMKMTKKLAENGLGIIYITHYLEEVFAIADTITILKDGAVVGRLNKEECTVEQVISKMVGRDTSLYFTREKAEIGEPVLRVENMTRLPVVNKVSFDLRKGEILGIGGLVGSGRSELMNLLFGVDKKQSGKMILHGKSISVKSPRDAIKRGICMLAENRKQDGLFLNRPVLENVCIVRNESKVFLNIMKDHSSVDKMADSLKLKMRNHDQDVEHLSGGNQQKCIIARWMLTDFNIVIFDEPTKGVDIGAREDIYNLMVDLAKAGKSIIIVSSDMPELLSMSDRICVMREGRMEDIVDPKQVDEEKLLKIYMGVA